MSDAKYFKWGDLKSTVRTLLTVDSNRLGLQDVTNPDGSVTPGFISLMMRQAVLDLQFYIPAYCVFHETIYYPQDFAIEGRASRGVLPPLAKIRDMFMVNVADNHRHPVLQNWPWENRFELVHGMLTLPDNNGRVAIEPNAYTFYAYPAILGNWVLSVNWDGRKTEFQDCEETPFGEEAVLAIAQFVKAHIAREVENDIQKFDSYMSNDPKNEGSYVKARRNCFLHARERSR